jgi:hypothetical protein
MATIYTSFQETIFGGRLFVHTSVDPYTLVKPVSDIIRGMSVDQPVEHAATLADIRAEVLTPDRLATVVFGIFAAVALLIALVGVSGVLAFSVSARIREFGIRLALGTPPQRLLAGVIREGAVIAPSECLLAPSAAIGSLVLQQSTLLTCACLTHCLSRLGTSASRRRSHFVCVAGSTCLSRRRHPRLRSE